MRFAQSSWQEPRLDIAAEPHLRAGAGWRGRFGGEKKGADRSEHMFGRDQGWRIKLQGKDWEEKNKTCVIT